MYVEPSNRTEARTAHQHRAARTGAMLPGDESGQPRAPIDLGSFYTEHGPRLKMIFARMVRDMPTIDAEEVLQETMSRASKEDLARYPTETDLVKWCTRVGINYIAKQWSDPGRRLEELHPDPHFASGPAPARGVNLEDLVIHRDELRRVFPELSEDHREVLLLAAADYSYDQMAEILEISRDALSKRLRRARAAAQLILGPPTVAVAMLAFARKPLRALRNPPHPIAASVMSVAMAAVLVFPIPGPGAPGPFLRKILAAPGVLVGPPFPSPAPRPAASGPGEPLHGNLRTASPRIGSRTKLRQTVLPRLPKTCGPDVCAGSCPDVQGDGDRLYVKGTEYCVNESVTPACGYVPDNPTVGCERRGDPQWLIGPPPSPIPKGEPL